MTRYYFSIFIVSTFMKNATSVYQTGSFTYKGNVSYSDVSLLISEQESDDTSLRYCAAECYKNLDCNAIELCSLPTGNVCRLSKSISTNFVTGVGSCSRHELVRNKYLDFFWLQVDYHAISTNKLKLLNFTYFLQVSITNKYVIDFIR